ncbi:seminal metalloprotease 1-like isoform X2 [Maniola hyperantus]|uniref:seminal metalloprotease 1-like isoform X2 n=1 Tax=Aphantopus hyperantus TaxID=2795564 RepID=UPI001568CCA6|nr:zinc metalloproteinase nas-13-like isoform X2 [Maniola hyperantus]
MVLCAFVVLVLAIFANAAPVEEKWYSLEIEEPFTDDYDAELGEHFEGDIVLTSVQKQAIESHHTSTERNGLKDTTKRWPNRTVVYHIVEDDFNATQLKMIEEGMADIANQSCIEFRPRKENSEHAVTIQGSENGCFSNVGLITKEDKEDQEEGNEEVRQVLNLAKGCFKHGTVVHEMLHTLGFFHMQSTYDRDDFVEIVWENILSGVEYNFKKYTVDTATDFGISYDYGSVMHYSSVAFTKNGNKTIIPLQENVEIGQRKGLSEKDVLKLNKMYCQEVRSGINLLN